MAPIGDLEARDLGWISDFVMQQMVIMLRPVMDHLQQSDYEVDHTQRMVQQLSVNLSDLQRDVERTGKCLAILRQGLGAQNESRCALRCDLEGVTATLKRIDEQTGGMLQVIRSLEDSVTQQGTEVCGVSTRQEELAKQAATSASALEDLQVKLDAMSKADPWLKKPFPSADLSSSGNAKGRPGRDPATAGSGQSGLGLMDTSSSHSGSGHASRHLGRVNSGSGRGLAQQDQLEFDVRPRSSSRTMVWGKVNGADPEDSGLVSIGADAPLTDPKLPVLVARRSNVAVPPDRIPSEAPRLRFTATMAKPPTNNSSLQ